MGCTAAQITAKVVCVTVVTELSLRLRWPFAVSRFAKNCWDKEKKEGKFGSALHVLQN